MDKSTMFGLLILIMFAGGCGFILLKNYRLDHPKQEISDKPQIPDDQLISENNLSSKQDSIEKVKADSLQNLITMEKERGAKICRERGHVFEKCETPLYKLVWKFKYLSSGSCRSGIAFSGGQIINDEYPEATLKDYPDRSELVKTVTEEKYCYRCGETIKTTTEEVVKTIWKK